MPIDPQDARQFPYIIGYCHFAAYSDDWTAEQLRIARAAKAPLRTARVWIEPVNGAVRIRTVEVFSPAFTARLVQHMRELDMGLHLLDPEMEERVSTREKNQADGFYQGDQVINILTSKRGGITFADPHEHESHVRLNTGDVEIWPHTDIAHVAA